MSAAPSTAPTAEGPTTAAPTTYGFPPGSVLSDEVPAGFRRTARTTVVGGGERDLQRLGALVLDWQLQRRVGMRVLDAAGQDAAAVREGLESRLSVPLVTAFGAEVRLLAPTRVVRVVRTERTVGFAYGTMPGHPVRGEESFMVQLRDDDRVLLELRTLSRTAFPFALALPLAGAFQERYAARYLQALLP